MRLCLAALLLIGCATVRPNDGAVEGTPYIEVTSDTERLSCTGRSAGDAFGSRMARSPVLVAPGAARSSYAEVTASATEWKDGARDCRNLSRLYVADGGEFRVAFEQDPGAEGQTGNSLKLIDWSADGSRLLMELTLWTYPTDVVNPLIVVYDATNNTTRQLPVEAELKKRYPGKCFVGIRGAGFTPQGQVVVESGPHRRTVSFPAPDCTRDRVLWMFNEPEQSIEALPPSFRLTRYATVHSGPG